MDFLQKNLQAMPKLKELYTHYKNQLYSTEMSKNNSLTLKINNIYLHSKYDPIKETTRIIDFLLQEHEEVDIFIIYGCGLGYLVRELYEKVIKKNNSTILPYIIYIEADIKIFLTSITKFDWSEMLMSEQVRFFLEAEKELIGSFIQTIPTKRIRYYHHRPSYEFHENYYKETQNYITYVLDRKDMNTATFTRFQRLWTKNFLYNLPVYIKSNTIKDLKGIAQGSTSVVVAGGPTLEKNIQYLKSIKNDVIIIAVDTVYKYLKRNSIIPDILVVIDPQFWNYKYIENEKINESIIVSESSVYHKVLKVTSPNKYFIGSSIFQIAKFFDKDNDSRGSLAAGGSVATSAFDIARIVGSTEIILIGLDLSFPYRMTHFKGSFFETNFLNFCNYFNTAEYLSYNYLTHTSLRMINATNGKVFTDQKMFLFKKWFDREIPLTDAKVYLPDSGGALLEGVILLNPNNLPEPKKEKKIMYQQNLNKVLENNKNTNWDNIKSKINLILKHSKDIKNISQKIFNLIPESGKVKPENNKKINEFEQILFNDTKRAEVVRAISASAQDILLSIMENIDYDENKIISAWLKTRMLYDSIIKLCDFYNDCLKKIL